MVREIVINKKGFYGALRLILPYLILFAFQGCVTMPPEFTGDLVRHERTFSAGYEAVWEATMEALEGVRIKKANKETGKIETEWVEERSIQKGTGLIVDTFWVERYRFNISISRESENVSLMTVFCMVQEKTKGGARSFRWERVKSSGKREQQLVNKIENILAVDNEVLPRCPKPKASEYPR